MMRLIFIAILTFFFNSSVYSNENEIIELHKTKTLDQLVLENDSENSDDITDVNIEDINEEEKNKNITNEENSDSDDVEAEEIKSEIINISNYWENVNIKEFDFYLNNINNINSSLLKKELISLLFDTNDIELSEYSNEIFYLVISKLLQLGEIQKSYNLIKTKKFKENSNEKFYQSLEINYLLSTYQLNKACELKDEFNSKKINLDKYLLEKTDIFCLLMENKSGEAELLNSLLAETEKEKDEYFQKIYNYLINSENTTDKKSDLLISNYNYSKELIFLYSAMTRIADLPLDESFLKIDPVNLSIPIILSNSTNMKVRLQAANNSYLNNLININSLAALYQSADFSSKEFNNPDLTIKNLEQNKEMIMAFYYQLANIQIFPSDRLKVILDFWNYSKNYDLEKIAYALTHNIISSIEPSIENSEFGYEIATAHLYNKDFTSAEKWLIFYENAEESQEKISDIKFLYDIYKSQDILSILEFIKYYNKDSSKENSKEIEELFYVIQQVLDQDSELEHALDLKNIIDNRSMTTVFFNSALEDKITNNQDEEILLLNLISLNNKKWTELHPEHMKLVLKSFKSYKNSELLKLLLLEIFRSYKIL